VAEVVYLVLADCQAVRCGRADLGAPAARRVWRGDLFFHRKLLAGPAERAAIGVYSPPPTPSVARTPGSGWPRWLAAGPPACFPEAVLVAGSATVLPAGQEAESAEDHLRFRPKHPVRGQVPRPGKGNSFIRVTKGERPESATWYTVGGSRFDTSCPGPYPACPASGVGYQSQPGVVGTGVTRNLCGRGRPHMLLNHQLWSFRAHGWRAEMKAASK